LARPLQDQRFLNEFVNQTGIDRAPAGGKSGASQRDGFQVRAVGTSVENAMRWIRETAGGTLVLVDAVFDESLAEGSWALYPSDQLDSMCHSTHSIPRSMLIAY
jgi:hypothetical protein